MRLHAGCDDELLKQRGKQAVRRPRQTTWRRERRRHAGVTFPARVINGSEPTKWRSFTALRCEREERKDGREVRGDRGVYADSSRQANEAGQRETVEREEVRSAARSKKND